VLLIAIFDHPTSSRLESSRPLGIRGPFGALELRIVNASPSQVSATEGGGAQVTEAEASIAKVGTTEIGTSELRPAELCALEVGVSEVGLLEFGSIELSVTEVGVVKHRPL
jgi:hypothetical protein